MTTLTLPRLTLRDYQTDIIERSDAARDRGVGRQLAVAATGLGKTVIFASMIERLDERSIVLAHRDELISQAVAKLLEVDPGMTPTPSAMMALENLGRKDLIEAAASDGRKVIGIVKAEANDVDADVVVASVQTISREKRLKQLTETRDTVGRIGLVVVDEAHHSKADSYVKIMNALDCGDPDGPLLFGVTATPDRGDGKGLDDLFDEVVAAYDILWGIRAGYLSDIRGISVRLAGFDAKSLKVRGGDYVAGQSGQMLTEANAPAEVLDAWNAHAHGRKTLIFTPTVALAQEMADVFEADGVPAAMVSGETPADERKDILRRFKTGEILVLANCAVLTEGYDEPSVTCVVVARPTKSRALYTQIIGRGTRKFPGKEDCLILDVVGASDQHSLVTIPSLFGVRYPEKLRDGSESVTAVIDGEEAALVAQGLLEARQVDLFKKMRDEGNIAWVETPASAPGLIQYIRSLGAITTEDGTVRHPTVVLVQRSAEDDRWGCGIMYTETGKGKKPEKRLLIDNVTLEMAQGVGEDYVRKNASRAAIIHTDAPWRKRPPTEKQIAAGLKWGMIIDPAWTAGEFSDAMEIHIAKKKGVRV